MMKQAGEYFSYSESFKLKLVLEIGELGLRQQEVCRKYGVASSTLRGWLKKYSPSYRNKELAVKRHYGGHIMMKDEKDKRIEELESRLSDALVKMEVYERMMELAKEKYQIDLKKNYSTIALNLLKGDQGE